MDRPSCKMLGIFFLPVFILGQEKLPLHVERISDCVAVIQTETGNSNVAVLASEKGLLMLDAGFSPGFAEEVRSLAQGIFQRDDWYGLIHTNPEILNAGGNAAFAGKHIIAHQEVFQYLLEKSDDLPEYLKSRASEFRDRVDRSRNQLAELEADSERAATLRAWIGL